MQVRSIRLLGLDDPIELDDMDRAERKRFQNAEAQRRYRERHPERVKAQAAAQYTKHRAKRLAEKKAKRSGPGRSAFLAKTRKINRRYRERHPERVRQQARDSYARNRVAIILAQRAQRRAGNREHFARLPPERIARNQRAGISMHLKRGGRLFAPVPIEAKGTKETI